MLANHGQFQIGKTIPVPKGQVSSNKTIVVSNGKNVVSTGS